MPTFHIAEVAAARLCMHWKDILSPGMGEHSVLGDVLTDKLYNEQSYTLMSLVILRILLLYVLGKNGFTMQWKICS